MGGILKIGKSEMFLHAQPQPQVLFDALNPAVASVCR